MADQSYDKNWFGQSLNRTAMARASEAIAKLGAALPCSVVSVSGSMVTVKFELDSSPFTLPQITIPKAESTWFRAPTQAGDFGLTIPADVALSAVSGQGGGTPGMHQPGNLSALVFLPVASKSFSSVNTNAALVQGPEGAVIQTEDGSSSMTLDATGLTITVGGKTWSFTSAGLTDSNGVVLETHVHGGVSTGSGETGAPQ